LSGSNAEAAVVAAYIQALCRYLPAHRPHMPTEDDYLVYTYNRFSACRFGLDGSSIDPTPAGFGRLRRSCTRFLS